MQVFPARAIQRVLICVLIERALQFQAIPGGGGELAGGWKACLFIFLGDLEYIASKLGLEHHGSLSPCALCRANKSTLPWTECGAPDSARPATWWATTYKSYEDPAGPFEGSRSMYVRRVHMYGFC